MKVIGELLSAAVDLETAKKLVAIIGMCHGVDGLRDAQVFEATRRREHVSGYVICGKSSWNSAKASLPSTR